MSTIVSVTPTYDANGDLAFDGTFTYGCDAESWLIPASGSGLSAADAYHATDHLRKHRDNAYGLVGTPTVSAYFSAPPRQRGAPIPQTSAPTGTPSRSRRRARFWPPPQPPRRPSALQLPVQALNAASSSFALG